MRAEVLQAAFDPWQSLVDYQREALGGRTDHGATATFVGTMRDYNEGDDVTAMTLEHYPAMTGAYLDRLLSEAREQWGLLDALVLHRVGRILPGEPIVLVAVWSGHRKEAFVACRGIMERLKHEAPFWKHETLVDGSSRWVEKNTVG